MITGLGKRVRERRAFFGWTQEITGLACGLSGMHISHFERGRLPNIHNLKRLAVGLGVSTDWLLGIKPRPTKDNAPPGENR